MTLEGLLVKAHGEKRGAQLWLAQRMGVSQPLVSKWVSGREKPGEERMAKLAKVLGVGVKDVEACFGRALDTDMGMEILRRLARIEKLLERR